MKPDATFPQRHDASRIAEQAFLTGGIGQAALPAVEQHTLHLPYIQHGGQPATDGTDSLAVL